MKDPMDDSLDNAEEDVVYEGNSKDDETSSSVDTLFKVEDSGEESCGEEQENHQGFRDHAEGSSGEDGVYDDAGGDSNTGSDRDGYLERVSDCDGYDGSPPSGGILHASRELRTSRAVISGFVSLGDGGGSLLDAFDPNADPVFVDRSAKNASPASKFLRGLRCSAEEGGCDPNFTANEEGDKTRDKAISDARFLGLSTDCSTIQGASSHKLATVSSLCDDGSEQDTPARRKSDRIEALSGPCQDNVSCCSGEVAYRVNGMGMVDKNQSSEQVALDAVATGRGERRKGKKGSRSAPKQVDDRFSAPDYKEGGGLSSFEGFDVGDVVGPERLTRSRASGRYVPVKNANGESVVILASSFSVVQKGENGLTTSSSTMMELSCKVTGKRSATRGGRLGWSHSAREDVQQVAAGAEETGPLHGHSPSSAIPAKKKPLQRGARKEGRSSKTSSGSKVVRKGASSKLRGKDVTQTGKSATFDDGTEHELMRIESGSAVKRRTPRQRSKSRGYEIDGNLRECAESTPSVVTGRNPHQQDLQNEAFPVSTNSSRKQAGRRGDNSEVKSDNQEVQVDRRQPADTGGSCRRAVFVATAERPGLAASGEVAGGGSSFSVENNLKPQGDEMDRTLLESSNCRSQLETIGSERDMDEHQDRFVRSANSRMAVTGTEVSCNGEAADHLTLVERRGGDSPNQESTWKSSTTDPPCESSAQLPEEKVNPTETCAPDLPVAKSEARAEEIGSDGPSGSVLDNGELSSPVGKGRALRPRKCKPEISNGTSGARVGVAVQPNVKGSSKQKKQSETLSHEANTGDRNMGTNSKGKRKRSGLAQRTAELQVCSENKSMNQNREGTSGTGQESPTACIRMSGDGSAKRRKKGSKTKSVNSKKTSGRVSGQRHRSVSLLKARPDLLVPQDGPENQEDIEQRMIGGPSRLPCLDVRQAGNPETFEESHVNGLLGSSVITPVETEMGTEVGEKQSTGPVSDTVGIVLENRHGDSASVGHKESKMARMRTCAGDFNGLSSSSGQVDAEGGVVHYASTWSGEHEQSTKNSSTAATRQEHVNDELPRVGWVLCDACRKWRCIPAELADQIEATNASWICKENPNKNYADCSIPQEKSNAEINAELQISEFSGGEDDNDEDGDVDSGFQQEVRPAVWTCIPHNIYLHRSRKHSTIDEMMVCNCTQPADGGPGCDENCLNRMLQVECQQGHCPCGDSCSNQQFRNRTYAKVALVRCGKKGHGLRAETNIPKGTFIIEYVGEVLDFDAFEVRQKEYARNGQKHFYFMTLDGNEVIDACVKGNHGRFINHSCEPNCQTQKWVVDGEVCIGLFATKDLAANEEITFDYNYVRVGGAAAKKCECGSAGCRGFIGGDPLTPRAIVESDSDEEEDPEPIMIDGSLEAISAPGRAEVSKASTKKARAASEPKVKGASKVAGVKRKLASREVEADKEVLKPKHLASVKRVKTSKLQLPKSGLLNAKCLTIDTSHRQQRSDVEEKLNDMLDENGGLRKKKDSAKHFLRLLVLVPVSFDSQPGVSSQRSRGLKDLALLLDALLKTRSLVVLRDIICKNGLMMLHNLIKHFRKDYEKLPIVRKLMKVLDLLAFHKVLTPEHMYASRPGNGIESFTESLFELTRHSDKEVQNMARNFRRVYLPPVPPAPKLPELPTKENGRSSPPKLTQPPDQLNARGRVSAPGFHQQLPAVQDTHNTSSTMDHVSRPALAPSAQKPTSQDWSPSLPRSITSMCGSGSGTVQPGKVPEIGKTSISSDGAKEQDGGLLNQEGKVTQKRKRKSRWDECTTPACPVPAGEAASTGQTSSAALGGSVQLPSEWAKQTAQGYQRYWHQQQPANHPAFRGENMPSASHTSSTPAAGPPLPPGFSPSPAGATPGQYGPPSVAQPNPLCGSTAGQAAGPHGSSQGPVPHGPAIHAVGVSSLPLMAGVPGCQHGQWPVRAGAPMYSGPPGFQVEVSDKEQYSSPWSRLLPEQREPWAPQKEQLDGVKHLDPEIEPEPPVPGLSPQDQKRTCDGLAGTGKGGSRDPCEDQRQDTKESNHPSTTAKVTSRIEHGSPSKDKVRKELWGVKSRASGDEHRGASFSGHSDRDKSGFGRPDSRRDRGQGHSRWEHSENSSHEPGRGERSGRYDWPRLKESGRGNWSSYQHSGGHGDSHHSRRPAKDTDYGCLGEKSIEDGDVTGRSKTDCETEKRAKPRFDKGGMEHASSQDSLKHLSVKEDCWAASKEINHAEDPEHRALKEDEVAQNTVLVGETTDKSCSISALKTSVSGRGDVMDAVTDQHAQDARSQEQPAELLSGHRERSPTPKESLLLCPGGEPDIQTCRTSSSQAPGESLLEGSDPRQHCEQGGIAACASVLDEQDANEALKRNVENAGRSNGIEATAVASVAHHSEASGQPKDVVAGRSGHKTSAVTWSKDLDNVEAKYRHGEGNSGMRSRPSGDGKEPDSKARSQWDSGCRSNGRSDMKSREPASGSHAGNTSQLTNAGERHRSHGYEGPAADVSGTRHSFRPGVDGWESPESPGFQEHVQTLVKHLLPAYRKLSSRDVDKLNGRLGPEVIKKERKSYMISTQTGCAKPIMKKRLDDKVRNFVDQQVRSYLAMKEKDRKGLRRSQ